MQELECSAKWVLSLSAAAAARGAAERQHRYSSFFRMKLCSPS